MSKVQDFPERALKNIQEFKRPTPGQSLTNSPDTPYPWEQPPQFPDRREATAAMFDKLLDKETFNSTMFAVIDGVPISRITHAVLYTSFLKGEISSDMMLLLAEPVMYMVMALAERAGIYDYVLYSDQQNDKLKLKPMEEVEKIKKASEYEDVKLSDMQSNIENSIQEKIQTEELPELKPQIKSLLEKTGDK